VPEGYSPERPVPLVLSLHGFGGTGQSYVQYWTRNDQPDQKSFIVVAPTGSVDSKGRTFWNATDACCDKDRRGVDDAAYLRKLIETVESSYSIDAQSIHVTGYSNGGFMAYRMACEHADKVASIVSVAGAGLGDPAACVPSAPVSVLQVHGLQDPVIRYEGGTLKDYSGTHRIAYPSAVDGVMFWARHNRASLEGKKGAIRDFSDRAAGDDTRTVRFDGESATAELWSIAGEGHVPRLSDEFHDAAAGWMLGHRKAAN